MKTIIAAVFAVLLLALPASAAQTLTIKGSDTMVILVQRWAEEYMKTHPDVRIQVTGGGSGTGFAALLNGTTDIAMASRPIKKEEKDRVEKSFKESTKEFSVAKDGVTFFVHASNPVSALTMEQLRDIFLGDVTDWKDVGGKGGEIIAFSRENSSGTYVFVKEHLMKNDDFGVDIQSLPGTAAIVNAVSKQPKAIGFGGAAYAEGVKELSVLVNGKPVAPKLEAIQNGSYPLSRDLYFYTRGTPNKTAQAFIDYTLSAEGQKLVEKLGYFPMGQKK